MRMFANLLMNSPAGKNWADAEGETFAWHFRRFPEIEVPINDGRHARESGDPPFGPMSDRVCDWIPACAGMTELLDGLGWQFLEFASGIETGPLPVTVDGPFLTISVRRVDHHVL